MRNMSLINRDVFSAVDFNDFQRLMFDAGKGIYNGVTKEEANGKIREVMSSVLEFDADYKPSRKELRRAIRRHKVDIFEVIEDTVDALTIGGWGENPFFNDYVEIRSGNVGDSNVWNVPDTSVLTVSEVSGGHHDIIRQRLGEGETFSVKTNWYAIKIYEEYERFMAGLCDWAALIQKIYEAKDNKVNSLVYSAFSGAGSVIPAQSQFVKTGTLTLAGMTTLIEDVQAANPGKEIVILGTRSGLSKLNAISETNWISETMKDERHTLGRLAIWEGQRLVEIPQVFAPNDTSTKLVDSNKLLVMPVDPANKMIKIFDEGEAQVKEISDGTTNMDATIEYEYQYKMGIGVVFTRYFGVWTIA